MCDTEKNCLNRTIKDKNDTNSTKASEYISRESSVIQKSTIFDLGDIDLWPHLK